VLVQQDGQYLVPVSLPQQYPRWVGQLESVALQDVPVHVTLDPFQQFAVQLLVTAAKTGC